MDTAPQASQNTRPARLNARARKFPKLGLSVVAAGLLVAVSVAAQKSESQETLVRRYPFDPACPWGRVANGKGMIVRCMSEEEANGLLKRGPLPPSSRPPEPASATPAPSASSSASVVSPEAPGEGDTGDTGISDQRVDVTVGPVVADQGELSVGKLNQPKSRYAKCITDHGGLKDKSGEVDVRFLVRSKGIAEGVSVQKRVNVSAEAARCVAEVVDRRRVGVPDAPLVGATVIIKFEKLAK
jgi:hypothetical protein